MAICDHWWPVHGIKIKITVAAINKGKGAAREEQGENLSTVKGKEKEERSAMTRAVEVMAAIARRKINFTKN